LVEGKKEAKIWHEVQWLCDWIEADFALSTFCVRRMNKNSVKADRFTMEATLAVMWASGHPETERQRHWEMEMDWLSRTHEIQLPEKTAEVIKARNHVKKGNKAPIQELEIWLIRIWPLVLHWKWNKGDLWRVLKEIAPEADYGRFQNEPYMFCRNLGLRGGEERGGTGSGRVKHEPPRLSVAKFVTAWRRH
jgi:hypothetical protein